MEFILSKNEEQVLANVKAVQLVLKEGTLKGTLSLREKEVYCMAIRGYQLFLDELKLGSTGSQQVAGRS